jgi:hypothetical protein
MDEKSDQILDHIATQRNELEANLNELQTRVRQTVDWRIQFGNHPMLILGVALAGGILLGARVSDSRSPARSSLSRPRDFTMRSGVDLDRVRALDH